MATDRRARGEGTIYRHKASGLYAYELDLGRDAEGKRIRRTLYAKTRSELQRKIFDETARGGGSIRPRANLTVAEFVDEWLEDEVKPSRATATYLSYEGVWRLHVRGRIGALPIDEVKPAHVRQMYRRLAIDGVSASMIGRAGRVMHRAFEVAIEQEILHGRNPFAGVERPTVVERETRSLTKEEFQRFLAAARACRLEALWILLVTAGLRIGEALGLHWTDVDLKAGTVFVHQSLSEAGGDLELGDVKTKASRRAIALGAIALDALRRHWNRPDRPTSDLVFCSTRGGELRRANLKRDHFTPTLKRAGIAKCTLHELRHTMTSIALAAGAPVKSVSGRLGHATTRLTLDRYGHLIGNADREAADLIDAAIAKTKKGPDAAKRRGRADRVSRSR